MTIEIHERFLVINIEGDGDVTERKSIDEIVEIIVADVLEKTTDINIQMVLEILGVYIDSNNKKEEYEPGWLEDFWPMLKGYSVRELRKLRTAVAQRLKEEAYKEGRTYIELFRIVLAHEYFYSCKDGYWQITGKNKKLKFVLHYWDILEYTQYDYEFISECCKQMLTLDN